MSKSPKDLEKIGHIKRINPNKIKNYQEPRKIQIFFVKKYSRSRRIEDTKRTDPNRSPNKILNYQETRKIKIVWVIKCSRSRELEQQNR